MNIMDWKEMDELGFRKSNLIQRLTVPHVNDGSLLSKLDNAFSFGGGLVNGGIPKEGMALIRNIFGFDYMGAAEFEWGAVPEALSEILKISRIGKLMCFEIKDINVRYDDYTKKKITKKEYITSVYVICEDRLVEYVKELIKQLACDEYKLRCKEVPMFVNSVARKYTEDNLCGRVQGWLELDNGFFFFINQEMFNKAVQLFGAKELK